MKNLTKIIIVCGVFTSLQSRSENKITGNNNNTNICAPSIIVKSNSCHAKTKIVEKRVEVPVEKRIEVIKEVKVFVPVQKIVEKKIIQKELKQRNRISILGGYGVLGNLKHEIDSNNNYRVRTEAGPVLGAQYMRDFGSSDSRFSKHFLLQIQTNDTAMLGVGFGF